jgi:hypothetical protein
MIVFVPASVCFDTQFKEGQTGLIVRQKLENTFHAYMYNNTHVV